MIDELPMWGTDAPSMLSVLVCVSPLLSCVPVLIRFHVILGWTLLVSVWGIDAIKTMAPCYVVFCIEQCYTWLDVVFWIDQISCFLELEAMNSVKQERLVLSNAEFLLPENLYMLSTEHFLPRLHVSVIHGF